MTGTLWVLLNVADRTVADADAELTAHTAPSVNKSREHGWIWSHTGAEKSADKGIVRFRYDLELNALPERAEVLLAGDNTYALWVNGHEAIQSNNWQKPISRDVVGAMRVGQNVLAVEVNNTQDGPAGFYLIGHIDTGDRRIDISGSADWSWSTDPGERWRTQPPESDRWQPAVVIGGFGMAPWSLGTEPELKRRWTPISYTTDWSDWRQRVREELQAIDVPADPPGASDVHPVDRFMQAWWVAEDVKSPPICDDRTFVRRAYLDAWGLMPDETQVENFLDDPATDKRERLIEALLANEHRYAEGWMAWWCDLLRNDEQTNIDDLRKPVTRWLYDALVTNRPYDEMIAHLLNPGPGGPDGYLKGINWRGRVNSSQQPAMQAAQNVGQVFLGTNIKCASCHDHFTRPYLLDDSYGLAGFFSEENLEVHRCDKPTGVKAVPAFAFADFEHVEYDDVSPDAAYARRLYSVSRLVTSPQNPRFARTMVNRFWHKLMGRGLIEPVDDYAATPANAELLDWLAYDFMAHDYDLKRMIRLLMTSKAYQLRSITETVEEQRAAGKASTVFVGPPLRRLTSEQYHDGICRLTGHWPKPQTMNVQVPNEHVRAWRHRIPDPMALALGRPLREQVATERESDPSMLQMLELVNGMTLNQMLDAGAAQLLQSPLGKTDPERVIDALFRRAFAREATASEKELLVPLIKDRGDDSDARKQSWADLCWILVMSPEFQFIQ